MADTASATGGIRLAGLAAAGLRRAFCGVLVVMLLWLGAVDAWPFLLATATLAGILGLAVLILGEPARTRAAFRAALALSALLGGWILLQSLAFPGNPFAHPVWAEVGAPAGSISIAPEATRYSVLWALAPLLSFMAALVLFDDDRRARRLLLFVGWSGGILAILSIAQFQLMPDALVFTRKYYYLGSLTAPFVNRNTAATYFGMVGIVLVALAWNGIAAGSRPRRDPDPRAEPGPAVDRAAVVSAALAVPALLALFMTHSRAGVAATALGFLVLVPLLWFRPRRGGRPLRRMTGGLVRAGATAAVILLVVVVFAGGANLRAEQLGFEDARFCILPALVETARETIATGAGFGMFVETYPPHRDPACGIDLVWDRAHNMYMEGVIGLGLPAMLAIAAAAAVLAVMLAAGVRARRSMRYGPAAALSAGVVVAAHGVVDFSFQIPAMAAATMAVLAAGVTIGRGRAAA